MSKIKGILIPMFIMVVLALSGTRPIKSSKSVNIDPKFIFYSAFDRKEIAKLYSDIWKTIATFFKYFEVKNTIFQNVLLTHIL